MVDQAYIKDGARLLESTGEEDVLLARQGIPREVIVQQDEGLSIAQQRLSEYGSCIDRGLRQRPLRQHLCV